MESTAVITGTTHGIGTVTARELARAGFSVVMRVRNRSAGEQVARQIRARVGGATIHVVECDLASLASVRRAAAEVRRGHPPLALLLNNAGVVSPRHRRSADGYELTFATNHLGPFLLTELLRGHLAPDARIVNLASRAHYRGVPDFEAVADPAVRYSAAAAYSRSKLANVLHTFALARRLTGSDICVNCVHPGVVASNLLPRWPRLIKPLISPVILDVEEGARASLHLALSPAAAGVSGRYFDEHQQMQPAAACAYDEPLQERLWSLSDRWTSSGT